MSFDKFDNDDDDDDGGGDDDDDDDDGDHDVDADVDDTRMIMLIMMLMTILMLMMFMMLMLMPGISFLIIKRHIWNHISPTHHPKVDSMFAGSTIITFGKYRGKTFDDVRRQHPGYVQWARGEKPNHGQLADFVLYCSTVAPF